MAVNTVFCSVIGKIFVKKFKGVNTLGVRSSSRTEEGQAVG